MCNSTRSANTFAVVTTMLGDSHRVPQADEERAGMSEVITEQDKAYEGEQSELAAVVAAAETVWN